ncbi:MAG: alpha/beta hydrolase [Sphingobacteriales bacterium]|nr:MAG: alpha/beta hydrolase [Sphingobacteriales bacterium]
MTFKTNNMEFQPLQYVYQSAGTPGAATLLLLHGTGGDEYDLLPVARQFGSDINVLSVRGNVSEQGMPRFFKRLGMGVFDEKDLTFRSHELAHFLEEVSVREGFDLRKVVALGYSNGANIAAALLLLHPGLLQGAILFRPMQPFREFPQLQDAGHTPVFMSNGLQDPTINSAHTERYVQHMTQAGFAVSHHNFPVGHNLTQEDLKLSVDWYSKNFIHGSI